MAPTEGILEGIIQRSRLVQDVVQTKAIIADNYAYKRHRATKSWVANQRDLRLKLHLMDSTHLPFSTRNMRIAGLNSVYAGESFPEDYHAVSATDAERLNAAYRARIKGHKIDTHRLARMSFKEAVVYKF